MQKREKSRGKEIWFQQIFDPKKPLKAVLVYPSAYKVASSSLGFQVVHRMMNRHPFFSCERAVLPNTGIRDGYEDEPISSIETGTPLSGFTLSLLVVPLNWII